MIHQVWMPLPPPPCEYEAKRMSKEPRCKGPDRLCPNPRSTLSATDPKFGYSRREMESMTTYAALKHYMICFNDALASLLFWDPSTLMTQRIQAVAHDDINKEQAHQRAKALVMGSISVKDKTCYTQCTWKTPSCFTPCGECLSCRGYLDVKRCYLFSTLCPWSPVPVDLRYGYGTPTQVPDCLVMNSWEKEATGVLCSHAVKTMKQSIPFEMEEVNPTKEDPTCSS